MQSKQTHDNDRTTVHRPVKRSMIGHVLLTDSKSNLCTQTVHCCLMPWLRMGKKQQKTHGKPVVYHEDQTELIFSTLPASVISHLSPYLQRYPS